MILIESVCKDPSLKEKDRVKIGYINKKFFYWMNKM